LNTWLGGKKCLILPLSSYLIPAAVTYDNDLGIGKRSFCKNVYFLEDFLKIIFDKSNLNCARPYVTILYKW
jgi:hypothetical protein